MIIGTLARRARVRVFAGTFALCLVVAPVQARVSFDGLDLAPDDRLLFRATAGGDGAPLQTALFLADAQKTTFRQLTAFPESMDLLEGGRVLQIRNPFGALRVPVSGGLPSTVPGFPSLSAGAVAQGGRAEAMAASPDGKWILYVEPVSSAFGRLALVNASDGSRIVVADGVERPGVVFPAHWSPDSRMFVYCREGKLFFRAVDSAGAVTVDERYRLIGEGRSTSMRWGNAGDFFYVRGSTIYRVRSSELFARALYADFLEIGTVAGKIPFEFDPNFDAFWVAPDSQAILLSKGGRNLFYYPLGVDDYDEVETASLPYLMLPRACSDFTVLWSPAGIVTVLASQPRSGGHQVRAYRLGPQTAAGARGAWGFSELTAPPGPRAALSSDGTRALVWGVSGASIYDYVNWKVISDLGKRLIFSAVWLGNEEFILADGSLIERRTVSGRHSLICLSSAETYAFEEGGPRVVAKSADAWYTTDGKSAWTEVDEVVARNASTSSPRFRAYLEKQPSGPYENLPMLRNLASVGTVSLIIKPAGAYETFPAGEDEPLRYDVPFSNGRRRGRREVAITFDLMDDAEGLPFVLDTLARFGVKSTFFMNGEFIRRHPSAAMEIADAGHEAASMFFAPIDLSDARYRIDGEFIRRGLARNEDEFFSASLAELSLLWHPPYYAASSDIVAAAASVGYRTIGRDVDPLDWITRADSRRSPLAYKSASELVDAVMAAKKPGSIIPIRLGVPVSGRDDYLFGRLDVLMDALVRAGYEMTTVSTLMEHAR